MKPPSWVLAVLVPALACGGLASTAKDGPPDGGRADVAPRDGSGTADAGPDSGSLDDGSAADAANCSHLGDAGGGVVRVASSPYALNGITSRAEGVYWGAMRLTEVRKDITVVGTVMGAGLDGCGVETLSSIGVPQGVAASATRVYWTDIGSSSNTTEGFILSAPLAGGTVTTLARDQNNPVGIAVDTTSVYWATTGSQGKYDGSIVTMPLGGGTATTLAVGQDVAYAIAVDATRVYWTNQGLNNWSLGTVMSMPKGGGAIVRLASKQNNPSSIAVDSANVYFANGTSTRGTGGLLSVPLDGGTPVTLSSAAAGAIAVDGTGLYFTTSEAVVKIPLGGGPETTLASGSVDPYAVAVDSTDVYFAVFADAGASVMKTLK